MSADGEFARTVRVPPSDLAAERAVLGCILLENATFDIALDAPLTSEDFYSDANAQVYSAMLELFSEGAAIDIITIRERLMRGGSGKLRRVGGDEYLFSLTNVIPTVANMESYVQIVRDRSDVRRLLQACHQTLVQGYGEYESAAALLASAERSIMEVAKNQSRSPYEHVSPIVVRTFEQLVHSAESQQHITGLPTGFERLDRMTAGMHPGDLIIVAGRPSMGKTAFAMNVAVHACKARKVSVAVFSLEMPKEQLANRLLCSEGRLDAGKLRTGYLAREDWPRLTAAAEHISELPIFIDDTPALSLLELRSKARRLKREENLGLIVVDYLQLMRSGTKAASREQEISEISRSLKALAKELGIPVVALSQLNRGVESRGNKDKRPQLSDLRESGAIEQDADTIMFIYRDEMYHEDSADKGIAEIIVGKQRSGPTGTVKCLFRSECTRFENLDEHHAQYAGAA
jgi:replicative DNA helicase